MVRWWGLGAFAGLVLLLAGGWWLFADYWLERSVEKAGTAMVGARVELDGADLGLFPIRVELTGLRVTNPRRPMRNAVAAKRIAFRLDTRELVFGRTRIDEVAVEGAALDTPRATSGALATRKRRQEPGPFRRLTGQLELPGFRVPAVAEVLAKGEVQSVSAARELERDAADSRQRLAGRAEDLPDEAQVRAYRQRLDRLRKEAEGTLASLVKSGGEAAKLKRDIDADVDRLQALKKDVDATRKRLKAKLAELRRMPGEDARRLATRYGPSAEGLGNVAEAFLGPKVAGWLRSGWYWYAVVEPYLAPARERLAKRREVTASKPLRGTGLDIHFASGPAEPTTVVREVVLSKAAKGGEGLGLNGRITDMTPQPGLWPRPLQVEVANPGGSPGFTLGAVLDHRDPAAASDRIDLRVRGAPVAGWVLGEGGPLPVRVQQGRSDIAVTGRLAEGQMDVRVEATVSDARMAVGAEGGGELARAVADALARVDRFTLSGRITGSPEDPRLRLESSLERPLRQAVTEVARARGKALEEALRGRVREQIEPLLAQADERLTALGKLDQRLAARLAAFKDLRARL